MSAPVALIPHLDAGIGRTHRWQHDGVVDAQDALARLSETIDRLIRPGPYDYSIDDVAAAAGIDVAIARRLWRAMGFPDPRPDRPIGTARDVEGFRRAMERATTERQIERLIRQTRVISSSIARIAEVWVDDLREALDGGMTPDVFAAMLTEELDLDRITWLLGYVHRHQLHAAMRRELAVRSSGATGSMRAVGFADLVGFTELTQTTSAGDLALLIESFEGLVYDTIARCGARLVKTIGDEVMFVADDVLRAVDVSLALCRRDGHAELPQLRIGLDAGRAFWFEGDLYGPAVNLASRVVATAGAGRIAATAAVRDAHPDGAAWMALPAQDLKGFGPVELWEVTT